MSATSEKTQRATKPTHTPLRNFRASDDVWAPAMAKAKASGETLTDVLVRALVEYVEPPKRARRRQSQP